MLHSFSTWITQKMGKTLSFHFLSPSTRVFSLFAVDVGGDLLHLFGKGGVGAHRALHLVKRVQNSGVVPVAELLADVVQAHGGHTADEIHGDLLTKVKSPPLNIACH